MKKNLVLPEPSYWSCLEAAREREISLEDYLISKLALYAGVELGEPETVIDCPSVDAYPYAEVTLDVPSAVIKGLIEAYPGLSFRKVAEYILEREINNSYPYDSTMLDFIDGLPEDLFD